MMLMFGNGHLCEAGNAGGCFSNSVGILVRMKRSDEELLLFFLFDKKSSDDYYMQKIALSSLA